MSRRKLTATTSPDGSWFQQAKFAMFAHWGPYSHAAGMWQGKRYLGIGEWLMCRAQIPVADYAAMARSFNPSKFSADAWATLAADAGMRYLVVTAKHHDGFAMFKSNASRYNIADHTPFKRDPMLELAEACQKRGIRLGFYYSQFQDWHAVGGGGNEWDPAVKGDFSDYFNTKAVPQVEELLRNYGPLGLIWFDTPGPISRDDSLRLVETVRRLQPQCLINSRIGNGVGDYETLEDQEIPVVARKGLWEAIDTHNDTWGYVAYDHNWKPSTEVIRRLVAVAAKGGNYMLNVGPTGLGEIPAASAQILREVGVWTHRNAEALYPAGPSPLSPMPWGECTARERKLFLHVMDWPRDGALRVPGLKNPIRSARLLGAGQRPLKVTRQGGAAVIALPPGVPSHLPATVALEVSGSIKAETVQTVLPGHRNVFNVADATVLNSKRGRYTWAEKFGDWKHADSVVDWQGPQSTVTWTFKTLQPGRYILELDYSCRQEVDGIEGIVMVDTRELPFAALNTGDRKERVPNHGWWPLFRTHTWGILDIPKAGKHTLAIRPDRVTPDGWISLRSIVLAPVPSVW